MVVLYKYILRRVRERKKLLRVYLKLWVASTQTNPTHPTHPAHPILRNTHSCVCVIVDICTVLCFFVVFFFMYGLRICFFGGGGCGVAGLEVGG